MAVGDLEAATGHTGQLLGREPARRGGHPGAGTANALEPRVGLPEATRRAALRPIELMLELSA